MKRIHNLLNVQNFDGIKVAYLIVAPTEFYFLLKKKLSIRHVQKKTILFILNIIQSIKWVK